MRARERRSFQSIKKKIKPLVKKVDQTLSLSPGAYYARENNEIFNLATTFRRFSSPIVGDNRLINARAVGSFAFQSHANRIRKIDALFPSAEKSAYRRDLGPSCIAVPIKNSRNLLIFEWFNNKIDQFSFEKFRFIIACELLFFIRKVRTPAWPNGMWWRVGWKIFKIKN